VGGSAAERRGYRARVRWRRLQIRGRQALNRLPLRESQKLHLLTFVIGGFCGLAAVAFHWLLEVLQNGVIYRAAALDSPLRIPLVLLLPALGGLLAGLGLHFYAPEARGSGIPQVKTAFLLERGRIPTRVIPAKMLLPAINIGSGASLGREGPRSRSAPPSPPSWAALSISRASVCAAWSRLEPPRGWRPPSTRRSPRSPSRSRRSWATPRPSRWGPSSSRR
jgi:hypothetical protein